MYNIDKRLIVITIPATQKPVIILKPVTKFYILKPSVVTFTAPTVKTNRIILLLSYE